MSLTPSLRPGRVLLTGATGFVGRGLAAGLAARGWQVRAALRHPAELPEGVEPVIVGDLAADVDWGPALAGVDAIVHSAGIAHAGGDLPDALYDRVNRDATLHLARAARGRAGRLVFLSSIRAQSGPTAHGLLTEDAPPRPTDAYGRSKLAAEQGLSAFGEEPALSTASLRPVVVYGPGVGGNMATLLKLARLPLPLPLRGLDAPRSVVSRDNVVSAVAFLLERDAPATGPLIVADPAPVTVETLVAAMRAALGRPAWLAPVPASALRMALAALGRASAWDRIAGPLAADPGRLLRLGWQPAVPSTRDGVARWLRPGPDRA